jgi:hypothetical protein
MCRKASDFGYQGIELACWGDHFEVNKAAGDPNYCNAKRDLLDRYDLQCHAISSHLVGQAVCDRIDQRHKAILPPHVWGDGDPAGVNRRAAEDMKNAARAAQQLGVGVVNGFTGSSIWPYLYSFPPVPDRCLMMDTSSSLIVGIRFWMCSGNAARLPVHRRDRVHIPTARRALDAINNARIGLLHRSIACRDCPSSFREFRTMITHQDAIVTPTPDAFWAAISTLAIRVAVGTSARRAGVALTSKRSSGR